MTSGVSVDDAVVPIYNQMKKDKNKFYVFFQLSDNYKKIIYEGQYKEKPADMDYSEDNIKEHWMEFVNALPRNTCRYAIYDFGYLLPDRSRRDKLLFICWCPDDSTIKEKMIYASSKDYLKKSCVGLCTEIQANDLGDLAFETVKEVISRKTTA